MLPSLNFYSIYCLHKAITVRYLLLEYILYNHASSTRFSHTYISLACPTTVCRLQGDKRAALYFCVPYDVQHRVGSLKSLIFRGMCTLCLKHSSYTAYQKWQSPTCPLERAAIIYLLHETKETATRKKTKQLLPYSGPSKQEKGGFQPVESNHKSIMKKRKGDCLGGPVVKTVSSNAGDAGSIPSQGTKIHGERVSWPKHQNTKQKQCCNKFSKDF